MDPTQQPLLSSRRRRRRQLLENLSSAHFRCVLSAMALTAVSALAVAASRRPQGESTSLAMLPDHQGEHGQSFYDEYSFSSADYGESYDYLWRSPRYAESRASLEEHVVRDERWSGDMTRESYAFWRFGLDFGSPGIQVRSVVHGSAENLLAALQKRSVSRGAIVFVDVVYWALERDATLSTAENAFAYSTRESEEIDALCVYQHTPNLVKRSRVLRTLLAYPDPLVLVLAGDVGCRLSRELQATKTHHRIFYAGDGSPRGPSWLPQGLELARFSDRGEIYGGLNHAEAIEHTPAKDRDYLFVDSLSTNGRKPSRERLVELLATDAGLADELEKVSGRRSISIQIDLAPESLTPAVARGRGITVLDVPIDYENGRVVATYKLGTPPKNATSVFALAPAGDVWSSGRILEAMMRGQIPVVDQTYRSSPSSAKGCEDPAAFWRLGDGQRFPYPAPFLFVDDWARLPSLLSDLASNDTKLDLRLKALAQYKTRLFAYLRNKIVAAAVDAQRSPPSSNCTTIDLSSSQRDRQRRQAREYYGDSTAWADEYRDDPSLPGAGCTRVFQGRNYTLSQYALCFSPLCVPPQVESFACSTF